MAFTTTDGHTSGASVMRVKQGRMLYGLREIAAALRCSEKSVLRYVAQYGLPAGKIGGRWCADEARLREWLERGGGGTSVVTPSVKGLFRSAPSGGATIFSRPLTPLPASGTLKFP